MEESIENVMCIKAMLIFFEMILGLKMNFGNNKIGRIGAKSSLIQRYASILNCSSMSFPFVYLGIPIGANPRREKMWDPIIDKCRMGLSKWKQKKHFLFRVG